MSMTTQQTERELFEAWLKSEATLSAEVDPANGVYIHAETYHAWIVWEAARAPLLSTIAQQGEALEAARKDAERYRWLRENSREPDDGRPYAVTAEYRDDLALCQHHLCFEEKLDAAIDAALISQKVEG
ncbi:MAG: hypothetical protein JNJ51_06085 [Methylobacillus glycogenes]|nr:hypothetical protein [Methylobacillus glycogenes]